MLQDLHIENYALIDSGDLEFRPGFNLLTGETGSGKSIVVEALGLLLGEKASSDVIRSGAADPAYPSLLHTWGLIQYRLGMQEHSRVRLEESRKRLDECVRDDRAGPPTKAKAMFHLARTLAELDASRSRAVLEVLLADADLTAVLPAADRSEAETLLRRLGGKVPAANPARS